jgi:hypothetical protein
MVRRFMAPRPPAGKRFGGSGPNAVAGPGLAKARDDG